MRFRKVQLCACASKRPKAPWRLLAYRHTLGLKVLESEKLEARPLEQEDCAEQRRNRIADSLARCRPLPEHCAAQLRLQELHCSPALRRRRGSTAPRQP